MKVFVLLVAGFVAIGALRAESAPGESHFAKIDGHKVHYTAYGKGEPVLVFIHGWACDETVWSGQVSALASEGRCLTIDLPGHGQSDKPEMSYTMSLYARAIDAVLRDAQVASAFLIGHSNGVPAVRQFYREFPGKVSGLVLVDGGLRPFVDAASMEKVIAPMRGANYPEVAGKLIDSITRPMKDEALKVRIKNLMLATPQQVAVSEFENTAAPELWLPDKINVPVLMILAKQPAWTPEYEAFVRGLVPQVDYRVWENVSHFLMLEEPQKFNDAVRAFAKTNAKR